MILKKIEKLVNGDMETQWLLTEAQTSFLINYAITSLIQQGLVQVAIEAAQEIKEDEAIKQYLEEVDPEILHKA